MWEKERAEKKNVGKKKIIEKKKNYEIIERSEKSEIKKIIVGEEKRRK